MRLFIWDDGASCFSVVSAVNTEEAMDKIVRFRMESYGQSRIDAERDNKEFDHLEDVNTSYNMALYHNQRSVLLIP